MLDRLARLSRDSTRQFAVAALIGLMSAGAWQSSLSTTLRAASVDALQYLLTLGVPLIEGTAPGQFMSPQGVVYDGAGRLYVTDGKCWVCDPFLQSDRLQVFGPDRQYLYNVQADPALPLNHPVGMAIDASGQLLVADGFNDRIVLFSTTNAATAPTQLFATGVSGNYDPLDYYRDPAQGWHAGAPPLDPLVFWFPTGVAIKSGTVVNPSAATADPAGRVAVVDNGNHRIVVLNSKLVPIYAFGGNNGGTVDSPAGLMEYPWGVAIDAAGRYYVADSNNSRIQVFEETVDGQGNRRADVVRVFGSAHAGGVFGSTPGDLARPYGVNFDTRGRLWVTDSENHRLLRVDVTQDAANPQTLTPCSDIATTLAGAHRCVIATSDGHNYEALVLGARGAGVNGLFTYPSGVAVRASGEVAVADTDNHVVQIFDSPQLGLSFAGAGTIAPSPHAVQVPFNLSVSLKNEGTVPLSVSVSPTAVTVDPIPANNGLPFAGSFGAIPAQFVLPGATVAFPMTFTPGQPGPFAIKVTASGTAAVLVGGQVDAGPLTLDGGTVAPAIGLTTTATGSANITVNDIFTLTVKLRNTGATTLTNVLPVIQVTGDGVVEPQTTPVALTLPGLTLLEPTYQFKLVAAGPVTFQVSASANYVDPADNVAKSLSSLAGPVSFTISHDGIAPTTVATLPPLQASNPLPAEGWYNTPVSVRLAATDNPGGSGVDFLTYMIVQENTWQRPAGNPVDVQIANQGATTLGYRAKDLAGNPETVKTITVRVDSIAPTMGATTITSALPPVSGWYRTNPTITFSAEEFGSGLFSLTSPVTITTDGANQVATGFAVDKAGNRSANATATVNVDKTAPVLSCSVTGSPIAWPPNHKMVDWKPVVTVSDATSGGATFWLDQAFSSEPDKGRGDGNFGEDMQEWELGKPDTSGKVRTERSGAGIGRTYTLIYKASDLAGNLASCSIRLTVPHDQSKK
jgi:hypothetical protein